MCCLQVDGTHVLGSVRTSVFVGLHTQPLRTRGYSTAFVSGSVSRPVCGVHTQALRTCCCTVA